MSNFIKTIDENKNLRYNRLDNGSKEPFFNERSFVANITRIKAQDPHKKRDTEQPKSTKKPQKAKTTKPTEVKATQPIKKEQRPAAKATKPAKKPFILVRPFVAFAGYVRASWHELRQVRWPDRKYTWKMTAAMLVYCLIFLVIIVLLDLLFSFIFNHILG